MFSVILLLIYLSFISMGLPDSLLGAAWPSMYGGLNAAVSSAGIISAIICIGTVVSSACSGWLIRKLDSGKITVLCIIMTAAALFGFSVSNRFWQLCLWAIPYGLGAGSVDAVLNAYVALHFGSRHMNWLHCFWGLGASIGPWVINICLRMGGSWKTGYRSVGCIQLVLVIVMLFTLHLWKSGNAGAQDEKSGALGIGGVLKLKGARAMLLAFFCYCSVENIAGLWTASYMTLEHGISAVDAAGMGALFYMGITLGRFLSGLISEKVGDRRMVRLGLVVMLAGILMILLLRRLPLLQAGLLILGTGCAPIFPCMINETPDNFGAANTQAVIGVQMAAAYSGTMLMPMVFGRVAEAFGAQLYPVFLLVLMAMLLLLTESVNRRATK